jgi:hypothetical protein
LKWGIFEMKMKKLMDNKNEWAGMAGNEQNGWRNSMGGH